MVPRWSWSSEGGSAAEQALCQVVLDLVQRHPLLNHRVAFAHRHSVVVNGVEVDGYAERRADLVLATVAAADGTCVVEVNHPALTELRSPVLGLRGQVRV